MPYIIILFVIVAVFVQASKQKRHQEAAREKQRALQQQLAEEEKLAAQRRREYDERMRRSRPISPSIAPTIVPSTVRGTFEGENMEGAADWGSLSKAPQSTKRHAVKPFTESRHLHTESSLTGVQDCPPEPFFEGTDETGGHEGAYELETLATVQPFYDMEFTRNAMIQGILYSEILGKPKARRGKTASY